MSGFSLKDHLFNRSKVEYLAGLFCSADSAFPYRRFVGGVMRQLPERELKQRIVLIAENLESCLPTNFRRAAAMIVAALPPPLDEHQTDDDFGDFILAPLGEFVVRNGLEAQHFMLSLETLKHITKRFSMEDAMRSFLRQFPDETLLELKRWTDDGNYHVRRLVSESTRPSLPWSGKIGLPVEATLPLLNKLHADRTRYVTRSVANHLNDIAKTHPELVVETLAHWRSLAKQDQAELSWMMRHALRTLIKRGHPGSLKLLGYNPQPKVDVSHIRLKQSILLPGQTLEFSVKLTARRPESLVVDYSIDFPKANGKRTTKVFKAAKLTLRTGESLTVIKRHKLLAKATTFRLYPGLYKLTIQVNGQPSQAVQFSVQ
ncbi:MAG: DNA alkylation repair protein [Pirellulaceae bacterium]|nr:DNA alkylation repair protein [Pirellulaceae bacterium]